jgi:NTE family protein
MTAFGLVLGGGGPVGAAWYAGLANGLADEGLDIAVADVIIGRSAGASAGARLASERSGEFVDAMKRLGAGPEALAIDTDLIGQVCALMGSAAAPSSHPTSNALANSPCRSPR